MLFCKVSNKAQLEHLEVESWKSEDSEEEDVVVNDWLIMMQMKRPHCLPSCTKESKNLKQQPQLGGQPPVKEMSVMKEYTPTELIDVTARFQQEAGEDIQAWGVHLWDKGDDGKRQSNWATSSHTLPSSSGRMVLGGIDDSNYSLLIDWIYKPSCKEAFLSVEALLGHVGLWKSINKVQWILRELGWDRPSMSLSLKALIRPHSLHEWKPRCSRPLSVPGTECLYLCWVQPQDKTFLTLGYLADRGETDKSQKQEWNVGKPWDRILGSPKTFPINCKESSKGNPEANVVWPNHHQDPWKDSLTTQCYVDWPVENRQTWKMIQTHSYHLLFPACCSRGFRHIFLFRVRVSHVPGIGYRPRSHAG